MEFQFGTNWAAFSARSGSVVGQPLAMEGIYAFFARVDFPRRVLLWARSRAVGALACGLRGDRVVGRSWLSGFFITVTDAWMQHPVGYRVAEGGRIEMTSLAAVLFSPFAWWQYVHVITRSARHRRFRRCRHRRVLSARGARDVARLPFRAVGRHRRADLFDARGFSDGRSQRCKRHGISADKASGDGRALRDAPTARRWRSSACRTRRTTSSSIRCWCPTS